MIKLTEKQFQAKFMQNLRESGHRCYKIPDDAMGFKPFDIVAVKWWIPIAIELKVRDKKKQPSYEDVYKLLRPNQVGSLELFKQHGWISLIVVRDNVREEAITFTFTLLDIPHDKQIDKE
jgi:Holliday junction resolvase